MNQNKAINSASAKDKNFNFAKEKTPIVDRGKRDKYKEGIFNQYKDLAYSISNTYSVNTGDFKNDLDQIALMELWECIDRYDSSKGAFTTYATWCITSKVKQGLVERHGIARRSGSIPFRTMLYIMRNKDKDSKTIFSELNNLPWFNLDIRSFSAIYESCVSGYANIEGKSCKHIFFNKKLTIIFQFLQNRFVLVTCYDKRKHC